MATIPTKVESRIQDALKRFLPVIEQAKARDVGEADTSTLVKDIFADFFGYDRYRGRYLTRFATSSSLMFSATVRVNLISSPASFPLYSTRISWS